VTNEEPRRGARLDAAPQSRRGREGALFALVTLSLFAQALAAQTFPNRPLRLLTGGAGGGNDIAARLIADGLTANLGQQVFVDNRPSGFVPGETVAKAKPDGYTLVLSGRSHWMAPLTVDKAPYDPTKDFAAITLPATTPNVLAVHPSLPVKSVKDLIALARARPGELNYGAAGQGSGPHLAGALFNQMAGVNIVRVNYRAMGAVYTDLMAGQVHIAFGSAPGVMPLVEPARSSARPRRMPPPAFGGGVSPPVSFARATRAQNRAGDTQAANRRRDPAFSVAPCRTPVPASGPLAVRHPPRSSPHGAPPVRWARRHAWGRRCGEPP